MELNEDIVDDFYDLLERIVEAKEKPAALKHFMEDFEASCAEEELDPEATFSEYFDVVCEGVSEIVNDSDFRSDELGDKATSNIEILTVLFESVMEYDENLGVVLATNIHTPIEILEKLSESGYSWEEDGVTNALARNTISLEILRKLATNEEGSTRFSVAQNELTPIELLETLASDNGYSRHLLFMTKLEIFPFIQSTVKYAVVTNPRTPAAIIEQFSTGGYSFRLEGDLQSLPSEEIDDLNEQLVKLASDELDRRRP
jgi:hypothetical protein